MTRSQYLLVAGGLLALLATLVFHDLDRRPLHHDEGVNGWFMMRMAQGEPYRYDPANYHGPSLFYLQHQVLALPRAWHTRQSVEASFPGISEATLRWGVAASTVALLALIAFAGDLLGRTGALAAALLAGASPTLLFYSRMFIHEPLLLVCSLLFFLALMRFDRGLRPRHLVLAGLAAALGLATKETFVLAGAAVVGGWAASELSMYVRWGTGPIGAARLAARRLFERYLAARPALLVTVGMGLAVGAALFTSFLAHSVGVFDALAAFLPWGQEAVETGHAKPFGYYFREILVPYEWLVMILFAAGLWTAWRRGARPVLAASGWALLAFGGYSIIPYKTPWLVLNVLLPMFLVAGFGVQGLFEEAMAAARHRRGLVFAGLAAASIAALIPSASQALQLTFREYDRDRHPQVYVHTDRQLHELLARLEAHALRQGTRELVIEVVAPETWPLPVSLREYPGTRFWGRIVGPPGPRTSAVIADARQRPELEESLATGWERSTHLLRPGVELDLYLASDGSTVSPPSGEAADEEEPAPP